MRIHIFNPDTDYALASGLNFYTPPASVIALRRQLALLPLQYAQPGDAILCLDPLDPQALPTGIPIFTPIHSQDHTGALVTTYREIRTGAPLPLDSDFLPWGWNHALRHHLHLLGVPDHCLPSIDRLDHLRALSHRRTTILLNQALGAAPLPVELTSPDAAIAFWRDNSGCWFKAPWSSAGRGVICTADLDENHIRPWCAGIIRRQGSVMAETGADRRLDFASEWECRDGEARFLGLSLFRTSARGKYLSNDLLPQKEIEAAISQAIPGFDLRMLVSAQASALEAYIAPNYDGLLGIDMLADGPHLRPCVELNLRRTMAHHLLK